MEAEQIREKLLEAAMPHVPFDGWSAVTFAAALADLRADLNADSGSNAGIEPGLVQALFPRGGTDLALAYHAKGDRELVAKLEALAADGQLAAMRFRDRVVTAVMLRLELADREAVRRGTALFALPQNAADGAAAIWRTADAIWTALGDTADDINWYSKRATLSAVYGATVLYWLGDDSPDMQSTRDFLTRRVEAVMGFEKAKAAFLNNPMGKVLAAGPLALLSWVKPPPRRDDLPGNPNGRSRRPF